MQTLINATILDRSINPEKADYAQKAKTRDQ